MLDHALSADTMYTHDFANKVAGFRHDVCGPEIAPLSVLHPMIELQPPDWWHQLPALSGATLQLREVDECDVEALFELLTEPSVSRYISPPPQPLPRSRVSSGGRIGSAGPGIVSATPSSPMVCTRLSDCFSCARRAIVQNCGMGLRHGHRVLVHRYFPGSGSAGSEFAFREMGVHRLEARAVNKNGRGNRALEKLGAKGEAVMRNAFGQQDTQFLWAILADEWRPPVAPPRTPFDAAKISAEIAQAIASTRAYPAKRPKTPGEEPFPFFLTDPETPTDK